MTLTICVDFDGVLHSYTSGWQGADVVMDDPMPGAFEWLESLTHGFDVCVYSSRSATPSGVNAMREWFALHSLPPLTLSRLRFPTEKPPAWVTIDDRCIPFRGVFPTAAELKSFKPWKVGQPRDGESPHCPEDEEDVPPQDRSFRSVAREVDE